MLVVARFLKPLAHSPANCVKCFCPMELLEPVKDRTWLAQATNALNQHWQKKNAAKQLHRPKLGAHLENQEAINKVNTP